MFDGLVYQPTALNSCHDLPKREVFFNFRSADYDGWFYQCQIYYSTGIEAKKKKKKSSALRKTSSHRKSCWHGRNSSCPGSRLTAKGPFSKCIEFFIYISLYLAIAFRARSTYYLPFPPPPPSLWYPVSKLRAITSLSPNRYQKKKPPPPLVDDGLQ